MQWYKTYLSSANAWESFVLAAGAFGGFAPEELGKILKEEGAPESTLEVATMVNRANCAAMERSPDGYPDPAPLVLRMGHFWSVEYGAGRTWVRLLPTSTGASMEVNGPVEAMESISTRVQAAGGPAYDPNGYVASGYGFSADEEVE